MACLLVPAAESIVVAATKKVVEKNETSVDSTSIPMSVKLSWLSKLLMGGAILLLFEHVWHGEIVPWFPFLTAANDPTDFAEMLHEMATVGVTMTIVVTLVWAVACAVLEHALKKESQTVNA